MTPAQASAPAGTITIHQPDFLPWLGFFGRWAQSDLLIILDDVQFIRQGWHHRDKIKTQNGVIWLTLPVIKKGRFHQRIRDVEIDGSRAWQRKHLAAIRLAYGRAPFFQSTFDGLEGVYRQAPGKLMDFNLNLLHWAASLLDITTPIRLSSDFKVPGRASEKLLNLVRTANGTTYLTGAGSLDYLDTAAFGQTGIDVIFKPGPDIQYPQLHGDFQPGLSVLDYLMMTGGRNFSKDINQ